MKVLVILCAVIFASYAEDSEFYKTADDHFDIESLVKDKIRLQEYVDCFLGRKQCAPIPASYLLIIPEGTRTACKRCNPAQKHLANVFLTGLRKLMPEEYKNFVKKFDPEGKYMAKLLENVKGF